VQRHDYKSLFGSELARRKEFSYPPFTRLIQITFKHKMKEVVDRAAQVYAASLASRYGKYMVGPAEPVIGRIRNQYLAELMLKLPRDGKTLARCKKDLLEEAAILHQQKSFRSVTVIPDVDPV
ncbi:MAG: primosomal protein N', partial [Chitinophagaceae bacterium]